MKANHNECLECDLRTGTVANISKNRKMKANHNDIEFVC